MSEVKVRLREWVTTIECDKNPLGKKAMCWACRELCDAYFELKRESEDRYNERVRELKDLVKTRLKGLFDEGLAEILEVGCEACRECPEKPTECVLCSRDAWTFKDKEQPYVLVLVRG